MNLELTDNTRRLFFAFKKAIEAERKAQAMYKEAVLICEDEECRKVLEGFLEEEVRHEKEIMIQYKKLKEKYPVLDYI